MVDMQHLREDVSWCKEVLNRYRHHPTILVSHDILYMIQHDGINEPHESENGALIWEELVSPYNQVFMTVNGHFNGNAHQVRRNAEGQEVIQMLVNYQDRYHGGNGWLRITQFDELAGQVICRSYSPWTAALGETEDLHYPDYRFLTGPYDEFELALDFTARFAFVHS